jgi:hypothetical protein
MMAAGEEMHAYLDDLCKRGFYGEATFYFQNGGIESVRETARRTKSEIKAEFPSPKEKITVVTTRDTGGWSYG